MPESIVIDLDDLVDNLTLGEVEHIEAITGLPIGAVLRNPEGGLTGTTVMALAFVLKRRVDPSYTLDQARALPFADVDIAKPASNGRSAKRPTKATG